MFQAFLLDLFISEPDTSAAAASLLQTLNIHTVAYVARTNKNSYSLSFRAVVKCWSFFVVQDMYPPQQQMGSGRVHAPQGGYGR